MAACGGKAAPAPKNELPEPPRYLGFTPTRYGFELEENKLRVLVVPDFSSHLVEVGVRYEVGSVDDPPGKEGLAHLAEHMMFQQRLGGEGQPTLGERLGQVAVWNNALTMPDATHYMSVAPKDRLEELVQIETHRMMVTCAAVSPEAFERETEVVRNEMRTRRDRWSGRLSPVLLEAAYPEGHPYRRDVGGSEEALSNISYEDVCAFIEKYYVPSRAILVLAGHVDRSEVNKLADHWLSKIPSRAAPEREKIPALTKTAGGHETVRATVRNTTVCFLWPLPAPFTPERLQTDIALEVLPSAVLRQARKQELWVHARTFTIGGEQAPVGVLSVEMPRGAGETEAISLLDKALASRKGLFKGESRLFYRKIVGLRALYLGLDPLIGRTMLYADYVQFDNGLSLVQGDLERIDGLTSEDLEKTAEALTLDAATVVSIVPDEASDDSAAPHETRSADMHSDALWLPYVDPDDASHPLDEALGKSPLPRAESYELDNGMRVILLHTGYAPVVRIDLLFGVGSADDAADQPGLSLAAAELLSPAKSEDEINSPTEVGADSDVYVDRHITRFSFVGLMPAVDWMIEGTSRLVTHGSYDEDLIATYRKALLSELSRSSFGRERATQAALFAALYGKDHPYARDATPTRSSIESWSPESLDAFRARYYVASNATLIVTGRFDSDIARAHIKAHFSKWPAGKPRADAPKIRLRGESYRGALVAPHSRMVDVLVAFGATGGSMDDYAARLVLAEMLNARMATLREKMSASYGVYASFETDGDVGRYMISGSVDGDRAGEALAAIREGIDLLGRGDTLRADFVYARRRVAERVLNEVSSSRSAADALVELSSYDLPPAAHAELVARLASLEPDRIEALIQRDLDAAREVILLRGRADPIQKAFTAVGITDYETIDAEPSD